MSTDAAITFNEGESGEISCGYEWAPNAVFWYKGQTYPSSKRLIALDVVHNGVKKGDGYDSGKFDTFMNYSLIIKDVSTEDSDRYFCEVSDRATGMLFRNYTDVFVHGEYHFIVKALINYTDRGNSALS